MIAANACSSSRGAGHRRRDAHRATAKRLFVSRTDVVHLQCNVQHAIAMFLQAVAVGIGDRAPDGASPPVPLGDHLIDPGLAHRDNREFGGDEESIGQDERQDSCDLPRGDGELGDHG